MNFNDTRAIYLQIADYICEQILLQHWKEGERIPSVREMGIALEVNPNTVMRTYELLQSREIVFNKRGIGFFVADDAVNKIVTHQRKEFTEQELPDVFKKMFLLKMDLTELEKEYKSYLDKHTLRNK